MIYKKINTKKFWWKFSQNQIISDLFEAHNAKSIPNIPDIAGSAKISSDNADEWHAFYLGLDDETRTNVYESIEKINFISNFQAYQILEIFKAKTAEGEKVLTAREIIAENYFDKAAAFYLDYFEKIDDVVHVYSFYKLSGWKRYEAKGNIVDLSSSENKKERRSNLELIDDTLVERFESLLEAQLGTYVKVESKTLEYDNIYFTKLNYRDGKDKEVYFAYIKDVSEVIVKASGAKQLVFEYAENYIKKLTSYAMDPKEAKYNLNLFVNADYKNIIIQSINQNKDSDSFAESKSKTSINIKYPLDNDNVIYDWYVKGIKLNRKINTISFAFAKSDEVRNMLPLYATLAESSIDINTYNIESLSLVLSVKTNNIKASKKNVSLNIKTNSSNLNILKKEHRDIDKLLKDKKIMTGYEVIEMKNTNK